MNKEVLKTRIGKTPLIRAYKLEEKLNVGKIYLKLEGNNPTGSIEDRLAYLIVKDAISRKKDTICMTPYGVIASSIAYIASFYDMKCKFYQPSNQKLIRK